MKTRNINTLLIAALGVFLLTSFNLPKWDFLGSRTVDFKLDHDEIVVTGHEGKFDAIKIKVTRAPINMYKVVVHFGNGGEQNLEIANNFTPGSESRTINLKGEDRVIKRISFWYDTKKKATKKAIVEVWGKH